jgi:WD40 repeat protein
LARNALGTFRAVKVVRRAQFEQERSFEREFHGIQKFEPISRRNEGLVDILHVGRGEGYYYYVMELADDASSPGDPTGGIGDGTAYVPHTLQAELQRRGRLPAAECIAIACTLADALRHLHRHGLVHRDLKPSNIIFVRGAAKLADIGLVADIGEARSFVGTDGFIPPEGPGTAQADVYSLGKVLYEMCTGKDRKEFPSVAADLRAVPDAEALIDLNEIVLKACEADRQRRYQSAEEVRADLALLQGGHSVRRYHLIQRRVAVLRRVSLVTALFLVVAGGLFWGARTQARNTARRLYVAELNLAMQAWENGDLARVYGVLERQSRNVAVEPGFEWRLLRRLCRDSEPGLAWSTGQGRLGQIAWSTDGKRLFSAGADGTVAIWDPATGERVARLTNHTAIVTSLAVSSDGQRLATGSRDHRVLLWSLSSLAQPRVLVEHQNAVRAVVFSPDGSLLATGDENGRIGLRNARTGQLLDWLQVALTAERLAFSPDSRILAAFGTSNEAYLWEVATRRRLPGPLPHKAHLLDGTFSPDGKSLATAGFEGSVTCWALPANRRLATLGRGAPTRALAFSPDGRWLAVASDDTLVRLWDAALGQPRVTLRGHRRNVASLAFAPDGRTLATGSDDGTLRRWTLAALPEWANALPHAAIVNSLAFSRDGRRLLSVDAVRNTLHVWDVAARRQLDAVAGPTGSAWCVALTGDGRLAAVGGTDHNVRLWNLASRQTELLPQVHQQAVEALAFSPDDRWLATASRDGTARLWEVASRQAWLPWAHADTLVRAVAFSPTGRWVATGGRDGKVRLWPVHGTEAPVQLEGHTHEVRALAFSADGYLLASGGGDCLIVVWDLRQMRARTRLVGHAAQVSSLAFTPDGHTLASGSWDSTVKLWRVDLAHDVLTLREHTAQVTAVAFTADGTTLASASSDATVRLWETSTP